MMNENERMLGMGLGIQASNDARGSELIGPGDCSWCLRPLESGHHGCDCDRFDDDETNNGGSHHGSNK